MEIVAHWGFAGRGGSRGGRAAVQRALACGADRIELDVLAHDGALVVAHHARDARRGDPLELAEALELLVAAGRPLLADLKTAQAADALAEALVAHDWAQRTLLSGELAAVERCASRCGARRGWTLPAEEAPWARAGPLGLATAAARERVRRAAAQAVGEGRCDVVSVDRRFLSGQLLAAVREAGGGVYTWTVDRDRDLRRALALGVDGLITSRPRRARELADAYWDH